MIARTAASREVISSIRSMDEEFMRNVQAKDVEKLVSAFYAEDPVTSVVRLCFAKHDATLDAALDRMARRPERDRSPPPTRRDRLSCNAPNRMDASAKPPSIRQRGRIADN